MPSSACKKTGVKTCADRKSTRLNSSHLVISYAAFCFQQKSKAGWSDAAGYTLADLTMRRKEMIIGCVGAWFLAVFVPTSFFFFFNDPATTEIYTLSLHDALPI